MRQRSRDLTGPGGPSGAALAFAVGVGALFLLHQPVPLGVLTLGLCALAALSLNWRWARLSAISLCGLIHAQLACAPLLDHPVPPSLLQRNLLIEGRISDLPDITSRRVQMRFDIDQASDQSRPINLPPHIRLNWYRNAPAVRVGERWRLLVRLKPPHGFINPGGFDYERWLFQQGIGATGYVRESPLNQRLDDGPGAFVLDRLREWLRTRIIKTLGENRSAALVRALVLGDRDGLTPDDWQVLTRTGTNHLIAISGLHIGLIAGALFLLGRWLWARAGSLSLSLAAPRAGAYAALAGALGYSALAGFAVSTQRALVMLAVVLIAVLAGRTLRPFAALSMALAVVLLIDPLAMLSNGFWLSFAAVVVLLYALGGRVGQQSAVLRWTRAQWAVAIGLLPLLLVMFSRASLIAPVVNLVAVPLFSVLLPLILLGVLITLLTDWTLPLQLIGDGLEQAFSLLAVLSDQHWATMSLGERPLWAWIAAGIATLLLLAPRGLPGRWLGLVYCLPLILLSPETPAPGAAAVTILDVGQGLAVTVRTARHTLVYDLGPRYPTGFNTGGAVVVPYLRSLGIASVDRLIVSHADTDHAGGLPGFLDEMPTQALLCGEPQAIPAADRRGRIISQCHAGDHWRWDGVEFSLLHPDSRPREGNASSCVLRVATGGGSLLLTGDIGLETERFLLEHPADLPPTDILVAGHHGSNTSSSRAFLEQLDPEWIIYSAGFANRYGFPATEVRERVEALDIPSLNTAHTGAIEFLLPRLPPIEQPTFSRQTRNTLWRHHPETWD